MIKILFFGMITDRVGASSMQLAAGKSLRDIIELAGCSDISPLLVAVNQEQVTDMQYIVLDGDEVALMPPFSGG